LAVALRFFADLSPGAVSENVAESVLPLGVGMFLTLTAETLLDQIQRDWFIVSARGLLQSLLLVGALVAIYAGLRRGVSAERSVASVLLLTAVLPVVASAVLCAWAIVRVGPAL
jgi:hypothetical protein